MSMIAGLNILLHMSSDQMCPRTLRLTKSVDVQILTDGLTGSLRRDLTDGEMTLFYVFFQRSSGS